MWPRECAARDRCGAATSAPRLPPRVLLGFLAEGCGLVLGQCPRGWHGGWRLRGEGAHFGWGAARRVPQALRRASSRPPGRPAGLVGRAPRASRLGKFFFLKDAEAQLVYLRNGCLK